MWYCKSIKSYLHQILKIMSKVVGKPITSDPAPDPPDLLYVGIHELPARSRMATSIYFLGQNFVW